MLYSLLQIWPLFKTYLSSFQLRPNLEEKEDPTPRLLLLLFKSPPGKAGESKVDRQCTEHDKEATQASGQKELIFSPSEAQKVQENVLPTCFPKEGAKKYGKMFFPSVGIQ